MSYDIDNVLATRLCVCVCVDNFDQSAQKVALLNDQSNHFTNTCRPTHMTELGFSTIDNLAVKIRDFLHNNNNYNSNRMQGIACKMKSLLEQHCFTHTS